MLTYINKEKTGTLAHTLNKKMRIYCKMRKYCNEKSDGTGGKYTHKNTHTKIYKHTKHKNTHVHIKQKDGDIWQCEKRWHGRNSQSISRPRISSVNTRVSGGIDTHTCTHTHTHININVSNHILGMSYGTPMRESCHTSE